MGFGVFLHRSDSIYDDRPEERYQFPSQYLGRAKECVGGWIVYLEPTKVKDTRGYFAVAKVSQIIPDSSAAGMYLALIEDGSYLPFINPVPFRGAQGVNERGVLNEEGRISGRAQWAIRPLLATDFDRILALGFDEQPLLPRLGGAVPMTDGLQEEAAPFIFDAPRERVTQLTSRVARDQVFRRIVLRAYNERCAISGLKLINGGGRAEVMAAHIKPVEFNGPDIISNGIALSGTAHWMFDRGLISLTDDMEILVSRQANDPEGVRSFINKSGLAHMPLQPVDRPNPRFLGWHRENIFKR
jgi:putative restriction endonuclease